MEFKRNIQIDGKHQKPILIDICYQQNANKKPVIIFAHGFKGFKDWGTFDLVASYFASQGFAFVKFNFSHNGTTPENPLEFGDLEAFGQNNFSIELDDLGSVIDWLVRESEIAYRGEFDLSKLYLIGHSRGGGITILKAAEDARIKKLATWASVNIFGRFWSEERVKAWKEKGVMIVKNGRTNQDMPLYYQMYENLYANPSRLRIPDAVKKLTIPHLIIHGSNDEAVDHQQAVDMHTWNERSRLLTIENGGHTFGGKHPWTGNELPKDAETVVKATSEFFLNS